MSVQERDDRMSTLFAWLEQKLGTINNTVDIPAKRTLANRIRGIKATLSKDIV